MGKPPVQDTKLHNTKGAPRKSKKQKSLGRQKPLWNDCILKFFKCHKRLRLEGDSGEQSRMEQDL